MNIKLLGPDFLPTSLTLTPGCPGVKSFSPPTEPQETHFLLRTSTTLGVGVHDSKGSRKSFVQINLRCFAFREEKEPKPKCLGPNIFWWGRGLRRERVGAKSSVGPSKPRGSKLSGGISRDFGWDIAGAAEKFEKIKFVGVQVLSPNSVNRQTLKSKFFCAHPLPKNQGVPKGVFGKGVPVMKCHKVGLLFATLEDTSRHFATRARLCSERP